MRYIKRCENCYHEVRFPLDKGILLVTCPYCKHTFKVDPDDITTYIDGRFDLTPVQSIQFTDTSPVFSSTFKKETIQRVIVVFLFSLLFLNLFKSFGGFSSPMNRGEERQELPPRQMESQEQEDLEFI